MIVSPFCEQVRLWRNSAKRALIGLCCLLWRRKSGYGCSTLTLFRILLLYSFRSWHRNLRRAEAEGAYVVGKGMGLMLLETPAAVPLMRPLYITRYETSSHLCLSWNTVWVAICSRY